MSMEALRFKKMSMLEKRKWLLMNKTPPKLGNCPVMAMEISCLLAFVKLSKDHSQDKQFKGTAQILANDMWTRTTPERIQLRQPAVLWANASADPTTVVELQRSALVAATPESCYWKHGA
jgi:hypothetical protein